MGAPESPERQAESTDNYAACPHCATPILALVARGPGVHFFGPCGCRATASAHDLADDGEQRVMTDGGHDPWCDWCQLEFGHYGPDWTVETDAVTAWFCSKDCADEWSGADDTPERIGEPRIATDGGQEPIEVDREAIDEYLDQFADDHHKATVQQRAYILQEFVEWCQSEVDAQ